MDNNEMKTSAFATLAARVKLNKGKLPRVEWFRVDIDGGTGTTNEWHGTGYRLIVKLQGIDGEYATSTVAAAYGMKVKRIYKTAEAAKADGMAFKKTWGRSKVTDKSEKAKAEAADAVIAALAAKLGQTPETLKQLLAA